MGIESRFDRRELLNPLAKDSERGRRITVRGEGFIKPDTKFFAMGSCFAVEIRRALRERGRAVYPDYPSMKFDPSTQMAAKLPERDNINHYDIFVIRQEIERAVARGRWKEGDFWSIASSRLTRDKHWPRTFQDPHRRQVYASSMAALVDLSDRVSATIDDGLANADVIILTLGLTECWRVKQSGYYAALGPDSEADELFQLLEFRPTTFAENYENLSATLDCLACAYPEKKIVVTVSPVGLIRTWTDEDIVRANLHSKSTLRAVVGQICRERPHIIYWPSYEFAAKGDIFLPDGLHVRPDAVERIVEAFLSVHTA
ncbi:MAG TPA: GSCFA domain-containing protein [Rhizomicrobium sp.]|jgi:hypothetical protein|nr:GSCFA domain-containing protein [Rhizomicrobium sp.]